MSGIIVKLPQQKKQIADQSKQKPINRPACLVWLYHLWQAERDQGHELPPDEQGIEPHTLSDADLVALGKRVAARVKARQQQAAPATPGLGEPADALNGVIWMMRGDCTAAALSFAAMVPVAGWAATAGKAGKRGLRWADEAAEFGSRHIDDVSMPMGQHVLAYGGGGGGQYE